jgi:hypothetical protein
LWDPNLIGARIAALSLARIHRERYLKKRKTAMAAFKKTPTPSCTEKKMGAATSGEEQVRRLDCKE